MKASEARKVAEQNALIKIREGIAAMAKNGYRYWAGSIVLTTSERQTLKEDGYEVIDSCTGGLEIKW